MYVCKLYIFFTKDGMCGERGLESGSDIQTFEISLTRQFRTQYDMIYSPIRARRAEGVGRGGGGGTTQHRNRGERVECDKYNVYL